jgi:type IV pilus assembly protein PilA
MIAVSIVGVLAALAVYGVRVYLNSARAGSAKDKVGAISRAAVAAFEREQVSADAVAYGASTTAAHQLCSASTWVPDSLAKVQARKYQPNSADGQDFKTGTETDGWICLRFAINDPVYYRFHYDRNANDWDGHLTAAAADGYFVAQAEGDTDGDGTAARFQRGGAVENDTLQTDTAVWTQLETE